MHSQASNYWACQTGEVLDHRDSTVICGYKCQWIAQNLIEIFSNPAGVNHLSEQRLFNLGTCDLHVVHGAAVSTGIETVNGDIIYVMRYIFYLFHSLSARRDLAY